jgi:hypothetical protein
MSLEIVEVVKNIVDFVELPLYDHQMCELSFSRILKKYSKIVLIK